MLLAASALRAQTSVVRNAAGVEMAVDAKSPGPAITVTVPDGAADERSFHVLMPEHVTVRAHGQTDAQHLYVYGRQPGVVAVWKQAGDALEYETDFGPIHFVARATLAVDGIVFGYEFRNNGGSADYDMATAVTDPRMHGVFYDPRLERTYVHRGNGFALIASGTPERLTMPLTEWFPVRYLDSYTAPVPKELVRRDANGITYRNASERVDVPMIATLSKDGTWVAASFAREPGNVWTNPELTCQHVDPEVKLPRGGRAGYEVKLLLFQGGLDEALGKVRSQAPGLK